MSRKWKFCQWYDDPKNAYQTNAQPHDAILKHWKKHGNTSVMKEQKQKLKCEICDL